MPFWTGAVKVAGSCMMHFVFSEEEIYKLTGLGIERLQKEWMPFFTGSLEGIP